MSMSSKFLQFMFSKRSLPVVIVLVLASLLIAFNSSGVGNPPDKFQLIFQQVTDMLEAAHYSPKKVDDVFSQNIHKKYLEALDPDKNIFLQSDLKELKSLNPPSMMNCMEHPLHTFMQLIRFIQNARRR